MDARGEWQTPHGHTVSLTYRVGTVDWNVIGSCLAADEYRLPEELTGWAFDIGAHLGAVSSGLAADNPELHILAVEPVPDNVRLLGLNLPPRVSRVFGAVGRSGDHVTIRHNWRGDDKALQNAAIGNWRGDEIPHDEITYLALDLPHLMALVDTERVAWLKIDTEGAEWGFLDTPAVAFVDVIVGEWHRPGGHVQSDMVDLLGATHRVTFSGSVVGPGGFRAELRG